MVEVQSMILNLSFPKSLEEILEIQQSGTGFDVDVLLAYVNGQGVEYSWSVAKWIKPDDIIFFMLSKRSAQTVARLRNELKKEPYRFSPAEHSQIVEVLNRGGELCELFSGKIFLVAKVSETPIYVDPSELDYNPHWKSRIYAYIQNAVVLNSPIKLEEFNSFIKLSCGGSITPVYGQEFEHLKDVISAKNDIPDYLKESVAMPIPLAKMNKENWLEISNKYRHSFLYESQFRAFYVDYFLQAIGDRKTIFRECPCKKQGQKTSFVDNVIQFSGKYLPVEVKLLVETEENIIEQVHKYCYLDMLCLDKKENRIAENDKTYRSKVLVIDTKTIYIYEDDKGDLRKILSLDSLVKREDLMRFRELLIKELQ